eukprot:CAMPEP_0201260556 /NCGR_PEP_ID=MMETSP0853-20130426/4846_1 /ASSEMBLY_ACC=CAM_ASM_000640 /TAXON_ID=183588 /ORGANISM="Pseudo-nitzschia fraudulenta, Strain WWA7" /LENGTH=721 /DNA_ID=CAMNT_0047563211 /DNA_START=80 /DNA_END=2247 /DNA_ORIENTATION=+
MNHRRRNRRDYDSDEEDEDDNAIYGFDCDDDNRTRRSHGEHTRATFDSEVYNSVGAVAVYSDGVLVSQSPAVLTQPTEQEQRQHEVEAQSITNATVNAESEAGVKDAGTTKKSGSSIPLGNDESPDLRQNNDESCANATAEVLVATATLAGSNTIKSSLAKIKPSDTMIHNDYDDEKAVKLPWYYSLVLWGIVGALIVVVGVVIAIVLVTGEKKPNANIPPTPSPSPTNPIIAPAATPMLDSVFVRHIVDERGISGTDVLRDPSSPQHKAYAWLAEEDKATVFSDWLSEEEIKTMATRYILAVFYYALQGDNWFKSHGWLDSNVNHCKWQFVDCRIVGEGNDVTDAAFRGVTGIRNENNRLDGWLPNEVLYLSDLGMQPRKGTKRTANVSEFVLTGLSFVCCSVFLELSGNNIQGFEPLVEGFGFDSLKHLVLSKNPLRSHEAVFRLTNLETLILSDTGISGTLSTDVQKLSNMRKLELADNKLNGTLDARFQTMTRLERLVLDGNRFEGTLENILDCGNCSTTLASFSSKQNPLSGSFPPGLFGFSVLSNFALSKSRLTGSIPSGFGRLVSLTNLNLAENDYDFSPDDENNVLPSELGRLTNLKNLEVSGSNVFGTVPSELSNLSRLDYLGIAATSQTGSIAEEICAIDASEPYGILPVSPARVRETCANRFDGIALDCIPSAGSTIRAHRRCFGTILWQVIVPHETALGRRILDIVTVL